MRDTNEEHKYVTEKSNNEISNSSAEIVLQKEEIRYSTRDYPIEFLVQKFEEDDVYVETNYQRNFIWKDSDKCYFIESVLMGLPIPFMFFSGMEDGRVEIVDGAQRTQTLVQFIQNDLKLRGLKKLTCSNGFVFGDLENALQRKFLGTHLRVVFLEEGTTIESRQEIFKRINTAGVKAEPSETRRGSEEGVFMNFLEELAKEDLFSKLAPCTDKMKKRHENVELVSRFFVYLNNYKNNYEKYNGNVIGYIDDYIKKENEAFKKDTKAKKDSYKKDFINMLTYIDSNIGKLGFRKSEQANSTPRARFEALSIGTALALRENPKLAYSDFDWLNSKKFNYHTKSDAANNKNRLVGRIEYVKQQLLGE